MAPVSKTNIPEFSVSDLAFSLKRTLEETYGHVRVRGELGRVTVAASGHMYATLKDQSASIDAVCWKGTMGRLKIKPEEGIEVVCTGKISSYPASSKYQLIIESMELAGQGALLKMLEERRKKLAAEGLFDENRKRPLPFLPETIGVVTSPTGAVIRDILHRLADRFPRHVLVWPVMVQGANAAQQIATAINGFNALIPSLREGQGEGIPRPDLLIVARGGGSLEDLMPFNEEIVVRAAANSKIPLISAVGHETDTTLIDYAADLRAPTPTAAAEKAVPRRADLLAQILDDHQRLVSGMDRQLSELRHKLEARSKSLGDPRRLLELKAQQLDHAGDKMSRILREYVSVKRTGLISVSAKIRHPREKLDRAHTDLKRWADQLPLAAKRNTTDLEKRLQHAGQMLEAYSFKNVLKRGYAVVKDSSGNLVTNPAQTRAGQELNLQFADKKTLGVTVNGE